MSESNGERKIDELSNEAAERAVFARYYALTNDDELEAYEREIVRIAEVGGLAAIVTRCADYGEQAELLDVVGFVIGIVYCDGSLDWSV